MIVVAGVWPQPPEAKFLTILLLKINFWALPGPDFAVAMILAAGGRGRLNWHPPPEAKFLEITLLKIKFGALLEADFVLPMIVVAEVWGRNF